MEDRPPCPDCLSYNPTTPGEVLRTPSHVDLQPKLPPAWTQGKISSCTSQSIAILLLTCFPEAGEPSRLFMYYCARATAGIDTKENSGVTMQDAIHGVKLYGYCPEKYWPYIDENFTTFPVYQAFKKTVRKEKLNFQALTLNNDHFCACLAEGYPFVIGIMVHSSMFDRKTLETGEVMDPRPGETKLGGHAICIVGYDLGKRRYKFRNSWGPEWGQKGYGTISFEYLTNPQHALAPYTLRK